MVQQTSTNRQVDQATRLRALARRQRVGAYTLAVTSGKGGVGKTNIAVNLSICLAAGACALPSWMPTWGWRMQTY